MKFLIAVALMPLAFGCKEQAEQRESKFIWPERELQIKWSAEEKAKPVAVRTLRQTNEASHHAVLINEREQPHYHDKHELVAYVTRGIGKVHFYDSVREIREGDVLAIDRGTFHWVERTGSDPLEAFVVFNPPFDGKDRRIVKLPNKSK